MLYETARLQGEQPIQVNPVFISYNQKDHQFVDAMQRKLDGVGVRH